MWGGKEFLGTTGGEGKLSFGCEKSSLNTAVGIFSAGAERE